MDITGYVEHLRADLDRRRGDGRRGDGRRRRPAGDVARRGGADGAPGGAVRRRRRDHRRPRRRHASRSACGAAIRTSWSPTTSRPPSRSDPARRPPADRPRRRRRRRRHRPHHAAASPSRSSSGPRPPRRRCGSRSTPGSSTPSAPRPTASRRPRPAPDGAARTHLSGWAQLTRPPTTTQHHQPPSRTRGGTAMFRFSTPVPPRLSIELRAGTVDVDTADGRRDHRRARPARRLQGDRRRRSRPRLVEQRGDHVVVHVPERFGSFIGRGPEHRRARRRAGRLGAARQDRLGRRSPRTARYGDHQGGHRQRRHRARRRHRLGCASTAGSGDVRDRARRQGRQP